MYGIGYMSDRYADRWMDEETETGKEGGIISRWVLREKSVQFKLDAVPTPPRNIPPCIIIDMESGISRVDGWVDEERETRREG